MKYSFTIELELTQKRTASKEDRKSMIHAVRGNLLHSLGNSLIGHELWPCNACRSSGTAAVEQQRHFFLFRIARSHVRSDHDPQSGVESLGLRARVKNYGHHKIIQYVTHFWFGIRGCFNFQSFLIVTSHQQCFIFSRPVTLCVPSRTLCVSQLRSSHTQNPFFMFFKTDTKH